MKKGLRGEATLEKKNKTQEMKEKLEYIGLNLDEIPKTLKLVEDLKFRPNSGFDEKKYRQYRFVSPKEIQILLSPTNRLDDIKEKVTPELFTLHICMNMVGNWQCDGWWYIICEQVKLVPFIPEALNALGLFTLKTAFEKVISCFPQDTIFTDDNNYIDTVNFLQNNRFKVSNKKLNSITLEKRKEMVKKTRHCIEELEQLTEPLWGYASENNGWKIVLDYISAHK